MAEFNPVPEAENETEQYPLKPRYHPVHRLTRSIYDFLASSKLAMTLLVAILVCCVVGVTFYRGERAAEMIFEAIWFNCLLILLVVNVACCFFGRIWGRKVTSISFGMILFHLSFVAMFAAIVFNSLYHFKGDMRITEGETLINRQRQSYEGADRGRYFSLLRLKGETTFNKLLVGYKVDGTDKRVAYDLTVGEGDLKKQGIIYLTHNLDYNGFTYIPDREGYSILAVLYDKQGNELYGVHVPLQSLRQQNNSFLYTTGTKEGVGSIQFPQPPEKPLFNLTLKYRPDPDKERSGEVTFQVLPATGNPGQKNVTPLAEGKAAVGNKFAVGDYYLSVTEVRYWVVMRVNYEPGKPVVLGSLWVGLSGMIITTIGRILRGRRKAKAS
jgi:hypothetical protein